MFEKGDIVAVFGESLSTSTINISHPAIGDPDNGTLDLNSILLDSLKPIIAKVHHVQMADKEMLLVVKQINKNRPYAVNSKQCRLIERNGIKANSKKAKFIVFDNDSGDHEIYSKLDGAVDWANGRQGDSDDGGDWTDGDYSFYKAIDITDEV